MMAEVLNQPARRNLIKLVPALALANAMAIVFAGLLDKLGKKVPSLTGNGKLMMGDQDFDFTDNDEKTRRPSITFWCRSTCRINVYGIWDNH